jgi:hypothetical protein
MLYFAAPGDFLGPMRDAFSLPPFPGGDSLDVQELGRLYCSLVEVNNRNVELLERMQLGEEVRRVGVALPALLLLALGTH